MDDRPNENGFPPSDRVVALVETLSNKKKVSAEPCFAMWFVDSWHRTGKGEGDVRSWIDGLLPSDITTPHSFTASHLDAAQCKRVYRMLVEAEHVSNVAYREFIRYFELTDAEARAFYEASGQTLILKKKSHAPEVVEREANTPIHSGNSRVAEVRQTLYKKLDAFAKQQKDVEDPWSNVFGINKEALDAYLGESEYERVKVLDKLWRTIALNWYTYMIGKALPAARTSPRNQRQPRSFFER